jgi:hypothetical protein
MLLLASLLVPLQSGASWAMVLESRTLGVLLFRKRLS